MQGLPDALDTLINELTRFPGVGRKTAQRLAFHVLKSPREEAELLARAIMNTKDRIHHCSRCFNIAEHDPCNICSDHRRDRSVICVVEDALDVIAIEKTSEYQGLYHVLEGLLSPLDGIGPEDLRITELTERIGEMGEIRELILATNPSVEGETTAHYLSKMYKSSDLRVTRLARGIPMGSDVEYVDEATLSRALEGRVTI